MEEYILISKKELLERIAQEKEFRDLANDTGDRIQSVANQYAKSAYEDVIRVGKSFKEIAQKIYEAGAKSERGDGLAFDEGLTDDDGSFEYFYNKILTI